MPKKKVHRSASKKLEIVDYSEKHSVQSAASYFHVTPSQVYKWREIKGELHKKARQEPDRQHVDQTVTVRIKPPRSQPEQEPSNIQQVTGLGLLIKDIRKKVIEELSLALIDDVLGPMIDDRMPGIVSRELRKLMDEASPAKKKEKEEPAPLRAVKSA